MNVHLYKRFQNLNVDIPHEWIPKGPDAVPVDFAILGILINRLYKQNNLHFGSIYRAL